MRRGVASLAGAATLLALLMIPESRPVLPHVDVLLEGADRGDDLAYARHLLPVARLAKAYSCGTVPE